MMKNELNVSTYDKAGTPINLEEVMIPNDLARKILTILRKELVR